MTNFDNLNFDDPSFDMLAYLMSLPTDHTPMPKPTPRPEPEPEPKVKRNPNDILWGDTSDTPDYEGLCLGYTGHYY